MMHKHMMGMGLFLLLVSAWVILAGSMAGACPNCRDAISDQQSPDHAKGNFAQAFHAGIVGMLMLTGLMLFFLVRMLVRVGQQSTRPVPHPPPDSTSGLS